VTERLRCNVCGSEAEGTIGELHALGWRHISRKKGKEWKQITECPQHNGVMTGRER